MLIQIIILFIRVVLQCLVDTVRPLTVIRDASRIESQFTTWSAVIRILSLIAQLLKKWRNRSILLSGNLLITTYYYINYYCIYV